VSRRTGEARRAGDARRTGDAGCGGGQVMPVVEGDR